MPESVSTITRIVEELAREESVYAVFETLAEVARQMDDPNAEIKLHDGDEQDIARMMILAGIGSILSSELAVNAAWAISDRSTDHAYVERVEALMSEIKKILLDAAEKPVAEPGEDNSLEAIARRRAGIVTLETRGIDQLDFYDLTVATIKQMLEDAYNAGRKASAV